MGCFVVTSPGKTGSESFDGLHGLFLKGYKQKKRQPWTRDYDSLHDGRYRGCPKGPVWVPLSKVARAARQVGRTFGSRRPGVWAVLVGRIKDGNVGVALSEAEETEQAPEAEPLEDAYTLVDVLADLYEQKVDDETIRAFESILGVSNVDEDDGFAPIVSLVLKE